jgi:hypothetical protein
MKKDLSSSGYGLGEKMLRRMIHGVYLTGRKRRLPVFPCALFNTGDSKYRAFFSLSELTEWHDLMQTLLYPSQGEKKRNR